MTDAPLAYVERRPARSRFLAVRGLRYHLLDWSADAATPGEPLLVMLHGWMDVAASFQFVVDAMHAPRRVVALDWRGFGLSDPSPSDSYWFPDYLGDLDAVLDQLSPDAPVDLLGHSLGGNVAMLYAGVRPGRIRRLVNLEGFGMPQTVPAQAPSRTTRWLDELKQVPTLHPYRSLDGVAARLRKNNPRLREDRALWLAARWAAPELAADGQATGRWVLQADARHKRVNPVLPRHEEASACWARITAPLLWVEGDDPGLEASWAGRYSRREFHERLAVVAQVEKLVVAGAGHMLHHDQPQAVAARVEAFLEAPRPSGSLAASA